MQLVVQSFPTAYLERFLDFLASKLDHSPHLQFYLTWCTQLLIQHGPLLKRSSMALMAAIKNMQKSVNQTQADLGQMYVHIFILQVELSSVFLYSVDRNTYMLQYVISQAQLTSEMRS